MSLALPKLKTSAKSVQTTAEVCADYTCSLYRLQLKSPESTTYLQIYVRVLTEVFTCTHRNEYTVLTKVFACTRNRKYTHLLELVRRTYISFLLRPPDGFLNDKFYCLFVWSSCVEPCASR